METLTQEQFKKKYGNNAVSSFNAMEQKGYSLQETGQDLSQIGSDIKESVKTGTAKMNQAMDRAVAGEQGALRTTAQQIGISAGTASSIFGDVFKGVVKAVMPQSWENGIKSGMTAVVTPIMETQIAKNVIQKYNSLDPKTKGDIDAMLGAGQFALDVATLGGGKKGAELALKQGIKTGTKVLRTGLELGESGVRLGKGVIDTAERAISGTRSLVETSAREIGRIPERISTNVSTQESILTELKTLTSKVARTAVQDGVDISDVKYLYELPKTQKAPLKKLFNIVKDFSTGKTKTNPIEVVGKPIVNRIKQLEIARGTIGQKLGEVANNLGNVSQNELFSSVFESLRKVPGLNGLKIIKGKLNFSDTVLATAATKSDRQAIQKIFIDAVKSGTGKQKHLLRQELFEVLGGKKKATMVLTDTQEKAYEAIRKGLSDVLEIKNSSYKSLSNEYRKISQPLAEMRKFMKNVAGADEDILDMNAGLLARRLTSNAPSNPQIRKILRAMDEATKVAGKSELSVENLQDFYNILDRYYDIAGKTTFQGQTAIGVEKGIKSFLYDNAVRYISKTDEVKKKALEKAIEEALR